MFQFTTQLVQRQTPFKELPHLEPMLSVYRILVDIVSAFRFPETK